MNQVIMSLDRRIDLATKNRDTAVNLFRPLLAWMYQTQIDKLLTIRRRIHETERTNTY